ncbi:hypothetical protein HMI55_000974 [Coelomomyces lativittatus]|nr:hypothetical protein HMI56_007056 [Coelomomyces lativittatus]KAJ1516957.1 hypothetical protein HMI55_000974 [Coelomomyces lativittatus]
MGGGSEYILNVYNGSFCLVRMEREGSVFIFMCVSFDMSSSVCHRSSALLSFFSHGLYIKIKGTLFYQSNLVYDEGDTPMPLPWIGLTSQFRSFFPIFFFFFKKVTISEVVLCLL